MKFLCIICLVFLSITMSSCKKHSIDQNENEYGQRTRPRGNSANSSRYDAKNESIYIDNKLQTKDIEEIKSKAALNKHDNQEQNCSDYRAKGTSAGFLNLSQPIRNCMAKSIDESLIPLCEEERLVKNALKTEQDSVRRQELENYLQGIQVAKQEVKADLYERANEFDSASSAITDELDNKFSSGGLGNVLLGITTKSLVRNETAGFRSFLDIRSSQACGGLIDLKK